MAEKNHTGLIIAITVIGGVVMYEWWKGQQALVTTTTTLPGTTSSIPATTATSIDPAVLASVQNWFVPDNRPGVRAMIAALVPAEYAVLYDFINRIWIGKGAMTDQDYSSWDYLTKKYGFA